MRIFGSLILVFVCLNGAFLASSFGMGSKQASSVAAPAVQGGSVVDPNEPVVVAPSVDLPLLSSLASTPLEERPYTMCQGGGYTIVILGEGLPIEQQHLLLVRSSDSQSKLFDTSGGDVESGSKRKFSRISAVELRESIISSEAKTPVTGYTKGMPREADAFRFTNRNDANIVGRVVGSAINDLPVRNVWGELEWQNNESAAATTFHLRVDTYPSHVALNMTCFKQERSQLTESLRAIYKKRVMQNRLISDLAYIASYSGFQCVCRMGQVESGRDEEGRKLIETKEALELRIEKLKASCMANDEAARVARVREFETLSKK